MRLKTVEIVVEEKPAAPVLVFARRTGEGDGRLFRAGPSRKAENGRREVNRGG